MAVSRDDVRHTARLARLSFTAAEEEAIAHDMERILDYMRTLQAVDTAGVAPLTHVHDGRTADDEATREDVATPRIDRAEALAPAPDTDDGYVRTPAAIE
ncbi:Asp-tRNA(Asn)/Glu-tRNA(Gln) amidotransferase subunit GatC [Salisaeta longa]|uniref:Asp-tRNA(Asn)/Glu-tRNA(Gln) amidotransferase subunit GatC n=1 Tax=Salisaeta longa TaxID=503170 RepID=UPI0003F51B85|nr:Asp-tRNA(Asn)/Glu-tRNA(Gln) amidotransferase subunit GatC [Salisaeta longa]